MHTCKKLGLSFGVLLLSAVALFYYVARQDLLGEEKLLRNATRAFEDIEIRVSGDHGIKYIDAQTYEGGMYGLGVVHARDRLWQMYFFRMLAKGRVSEVSKNCDKRA